MTPTARQLEALRYIKRYQLAKGYAPTHREIADGIAGSKTRVGALLARLERKGLIRRDPGKCRAIEVLVEVAA